MVVGNKMAACLSPWPAAEPAIVDTTTLEEWEPSNYTWLCSVNKKATALESFNLLISISPSDPEFFPLNPTR